MTVVLEVLLLFLLLLLRPLPFLPLVVAVLVRAEVEEVGVGAGELKELVLAVVLKVVLLFLPLPELRLQEMLAAALLPSKSDSLKRIPTRAGLFAYILFPTTHCCPTAFTSTHDRMEQRSRGWHVILRYLGTLSYCIEYTRENKLSPGARMVGHISNAHTSWCAAQGQNVVQTKTETRVGLKQKQ